MPKLLLDLSPAELRDLIFQLPASEFLTLVEELEERAETLQMMHIAETGFHEWNEEGEDIYDVGG